MKITIKKQIFDKLDKDGFINDSELAKIYGGEPNFCGAEEFKRQWRRLQLDRKNFNDAKIIKIQKFYRKHCISLDGIHWYTVGRDYFDEINEKTMA